MTISTLISAALTASLTAGLLLGSVAHAAELRSVQNMKRERSLMVSTIMSRDINAGERARKLSGSQRRLVDLERMVLRDDALLGSQSERVKRVFSHYDMSFMVHASAEHKRLLTDHWLEQMGVSTGSIKSSRMERKQ